MVDPIWEAWLRDIASNLDTINGAATTGTGSLVKQTSPTLITPNLGDAAVNSLTTSGGLLLKVLAALTNGAGASVGSLTNSPVAGDPTKWIPVDDNGTTRYIPSW